MYRRRGTRSGWVVNTVGWVVLVLLVLAMLRVVGQGRSITDPGWFSAARDTVADMVGAARRKVDSWTGRPGDGGHPSPSAPTGSPRPR